MKNHIIQSRTTGKILYQGAFADFRSCLEQAVLDKTDLAGADLRNLNLTNACLDDGLFAGADFSGSNLSGANLSEARLENAKFINTDLYNVCMAYSDMRACDFSGAGFGATDITGSDIAHAIFSTLSCFSLDFASASDMGACLFKSDAGQELAMSRPPVVIRGVGTKLLILSEAGWMHGPDISAYSGQFHPVSLLKPLLEQVTPRMIDKI